MKLVNKNTHYNDRREIIIVDDNDLPRNKIDSAKVAKKVGSLLFGGTYKVVYDTFSGKSIEEQFDLIKDEFKFACLSLQNIDDFLFSKYPAKKELYISLKELPNFYFNLTNINQQILNYKVEAFLDFCSALGVKEARIINEKESKNQKGFDLEIPIDEKSHVGLKSNNEKKSKKLIQKSYSFPKPKYELHECKNQFYKLEPDWVKIQKLRLDPLKDILKAEIAIKKFHDFNLSIDFKAMADNQNINLGFNDIETSSETFIYELEFWEKE